MPHGLVRSTEPICPPTILPTECNARQPARAHRVNELRGHRSIHGNQTEERMRRIPHQVSNKRSSRNSVVLPQHIAAFPLPIPQPNAACLTMSPDATLWNHSANPHPAQLERRPSNKRRDWKLRRPKNQKAEVHPGRRKPPKLRKTGA